jgi:hypothetical protein
MTGTFAIGCVNFAHWAEGLIDLGWVAAGSSVDATSKREPIVSTPKSSTAVAKYGTRQSQSITFRLTYNF